MSTPGGRAANPHHERRWAILAMLGIAQLMVVLDATIVNIALPSAQKALGLLERRTASGSSPRTRSRSAACCCSAAGSATCSAASGPSSSGCIGFAAASAIGGAAQSFGMLVAARALQGAFGALLAPVGAVAADDDVHRPRRSAARRSAIFGAIAGGGAARRPAARRRPHRVPVLALVPVRQPALRDPGRRRRAARCWCNQAQPAAAAHRRPRRRCTRHRGPVRLVYGFSNAETARLGRRRRRWASSRAGVALLVAFVCLEQPRRAPAAAAARRARPQPRRRLPGDRRSPAPACSASSCS